MITKLQHTWMCHLVGCQLILASICGLQAQHATDQPFRIVEGPERLDGAGWRVGWESQTGRTYVLQRWNGDGFSLVGEPRWQGVATVTATGAVTHGDDLDAAGMGQRYYRVTLLPSGDGEITSFADVTGGNPGEGINLSPTKAGHNGVLVTLPGDPDKLYVAWSELNSAGTVRTQIRVAVYNGNDQTPSWNYVDDDKGASNDGLNYSPTVSATNPTLAVSDGKLYAAWQEADRIRVAEYNGNDQTPSWTFIEPSSTIGVNFGANTASAAIMTSFDNKLFVAWRENTGALRIMVRYYDHSHSTWYDASTSGAGLNYDSARAASKPQLHVLPGDTPKLYATWTEATATTNTVRVKVYSSGSTWNWADGGGATGLNHNTSHTVAQPRFTVAGSYIYLSFLENGTTFSGKMRVRRYDGSNDSSPTWEWIDGNQANVGINGSGTNGASAPRLASNRNKVYALYSDEDAGQLLRIKVYNEATEEWQFVDGGSSPGSGTVQYSHATSFDSKLYILGSEGRRPTRQSVWVGQ